MNRDRIVQLVALLAMLGMLAGGGVLATMLTASTGRHKLSFTDKAEEGDPPEVSLGIAMGAFRGMFVNFLWIRANEMKDEGRLYEAMDLARTITRLQPRFPQVWAFQAWNMAYNISVMTQTLEERWQWVQAGIRLLRDSGIPRNPNDLLLHKELAWIYLHKIGGYTDDANPYYRRQVAAEFSLVLGPPPRPDPQDRGREAATKKFADWLRPIVEAAETPEEARRRDPMVSELARVVFEKTGLQPDGQLLRTYHALRQIGASRLSDVVRSQMPARDAALLDLIADPKYQSAWDVIIHHLRKRELVDVHKMDPQRMLDYTIKYGPVDWRHPAAHGLYWSARGVENALLRVTEANKRDFDFINTDRVLVQSIQELWRSGEVYFDFTSYVLNPQNPRPFYTAMPNIHFIDVYGEILKELVERSWADQPFARTGPDGKVRLGRVYTVYAAGYENFVKDAIRFLYRRGEVERATEYKDALAVWEAANFNDPERSELFALPIDEFVLRELNERYTSPNVAREEIVGALQGAYISGLLRGDVELFRRQFDYARLAHGFFFTEQGRRTALDPQLWRMDQFPRDFRKLAGDVFAAIISTVDVEDAETIYDSAPNDLRLFAYDLLVERFKPAYDAVVSVGGRPFDRVFPQPEGLEEHRRAAAAMQAEEDRGRTRTEQK